jgi:hypothetical protein
MKIVRIPNIQIMWRHHETIRPYAGHSRSGNDVPEANVRSFMKSRRGWIPLKNLLMSIQPGSVER